jgi:hypothetical protein
VALAAAIAGSVVDSGDQVDSLDHAAELELMAAAAKGAS